MAARLGILPWDRDRMTLAELNEHQEGRRWNRSRDIELVAQSLLWLLAPHVKDGSIDFDKMSRSLPGYDLQYQRDLEIDKPKLMPWDKRRKKQRA